MKRSTIIKKLSYLALDIGDLNNSPITSIETDIHSLERQLERLIEELKKHNTKYKAVKRLEEGGK